MSAHHLIYLAAGILDDNDIPLPRVGLDNGSVGQVLQIVFSLAGGVSLIIITLAALRFVVANGDPQNVAKAKNTIIYAVAGLIISISGFSIVTFFLNRIPG